MREWWGLVRGRMFGLGVGVWVGCAALSKIDLPCSAGSSSSEL